MYRSKAKPGWHIIDDKMIRVDSQMEAQIIQRLVNNGFSHKWRRMRYGIAFGQARSTPDLELCVLHDGMNRRALVELKAFSVTEFTPKDRERMRAASKFYGNTICLLYIKTTDKWYFIEPHGGLTEIVKPTPGGVTIDKLPVPKLQIPVWNKYGRGYVTRPSTLILKKTADGLEFIVRSFLYSSKKRRKH
jgi:hypothetical protein